MALMGGMGGPGGALPLPPMPQGKMAGPGGDKPEGFQIVPVKGGFQIMGPDGQPLDKKIFKSKAEAEAFLQELQVAEKMAPPMPAVGGAAPQGMPQLPGLPLPPGV